MTHQDGSVRYPMRPILAPEIERPGGARAISRPRSASAPRGRPLSRSPSPGSGPVRAATPQPQRSSSACRARGGSYAAGSKGGAAPQAPADRAPGGSVTAAAEQAGDSPSALMQMLTGTDADANQQVSALRPRPRSAASPRPRSVSPSRFDHDDGTPAAIAAKRLYKHAAVQRSRLEEALAKQMAAEREARIFTAPKSADGVAPRVYAALNSPERGPRGRSPGPSESARNRSPSGRRAHSAGPGARKEGAASPAHRPLDNAELRRLLDFEVESELEKLGGGDSAAGVGGRLKSAAGLDSERERAWSSFIERQQVFLEDRAEKVEVERRKIKEQWGGLKVGGCVCDVV